jgi:hypothetical protein
MSKARSMNRTRHDWLRPAGRSGGWRRAGARLGSVAVALTLGLGAAAASAQAASPATVSVAASAKSVDTGVTLSAGEAYSVTATGAAGYGPEQQAGCVGYPTVTPNGVRSVSGATCSLKIDSGAPLPTAPIGALIGRIGNGPWFLVGSNYSGSASLDGGLELRYNDWALGDNTGAFTATITTGSTTSSSAVYLTAAIHRTASQPTQLEACFSYIDVATGAEQHNFCTSSAQNWGVGLPVASNRSYQVRLTVPGRPDLTALSATVWAASDTRVDFNLGN